MQRLEPAPKLDHVWPDPGWILVAAENARNKAGDLGHVLGFEAPTRDLLCPDADAIEVALDRLDRQADAAEEHIRLREPLGGALTAAERRRMKRQMVALRVSAPFDAVHRQPRRRER